MERVDNYRSSSLHRGGSLAWRNNGDAAFSKSTRDEDDEEALKWAALEKLPTINRLRRGLLTTSKGESSEVDIDKLGFHEKKVLIERLVRVPEDDNEEFLLKLKNRVDRVGIELPTIEVRFEHLNVEGEAHVGSRALPSFFNFYADIIEGFLNYLHVLPSRKRRVSILNDVSGIIRPSRTMLLLGPPSSGKTTLLLALAGKLDPSLTTTGRITYNGHTMNEFVPQRTSSYISQHDVHNGHLTVRETLAFAARCQGVGHRYEMLAELARREKIANINPDPDVDVFMKAIAMEGQESNITTDYVLKILGLDICADTMVGNEMIRGVSGGQRKRVTTGEMMVGPSMALFMDEISTGLDSSTTFQIINSIKQYIQIMKGTAVISLLQPPPETYNLFDDIMLLSEGQIVYQGPREFVLEFFQYVGFKCPDRKSVADFLQEVTSRKDQHQYWMNENEPYSFVTVAEFANAFESFHVGIKFREELSVPFDKSKSHPAALTTRKYGVRRWELFKACFSKELLLMKRNSFYYKFKLSQITFLAMVSMTLLLRTEMHRDSVSNGGIYAGSLFFAVSVLMFQGIAEISMTVETLAVFYKQRDHFFYPAWAFSLPQWFLKVPITLVEVSVWVFMTYYVIGYDPNAERLFRQFLVLILVNQMASALFRFIGTVGRTMIIANTFGTIALLLFFTLSGFVITHDKIKKWWIWGYWISPMMYGQNAMVANEFFGKSWNHVLLDSPEPLGIEILKFRGFFTEPNWYWIGAGGLFGFILLFNLCGTLALAYLNPFSKPQTVMVQDPTSREQNGDVQLSDQSKGNHNQKKKKGMILPFEPHSITFNEVKYSVDLPQEMKNEHVTQDKLELLKGVSGAFRPQVLTALMGVSGAGKTTLMDVLAGRKTGGYIEGNITISGYPKKQETFARILGYCEQIDIHSPHVTVYESLLYSAWLRLPREVNIEIRKMFVDEVMDLIELTPLRQALVGFPGVIGLSTEQRKRLTIAVELVANPSIIFMDEPTSGLDARAAAIVMRAVRNTVDTGRTVVCTIHQPSIDIFEAFDELFLMKRGGQEIYVGPLDHQSCNLINYFEAISGVHKIQDGLNPATWMLEVTTSAQEAMLGIDFANVYRNSDLYKRNKALIQELSKATPDSKDLHFPSQYSQSFLIQCSACLWKQHKSYWRNPQYTAVRFFFTTLVALLFGSIFWDLGFKEKITSKDLFNAMGSMYAAIIFLGLIYASTVQPVVDVERSVFYRERSSRMYSPLSYAYAQVFVELPYIFVQTVIYSAIVYAMIGFQWTAAKFFWYLFFMFFTLLYFTLFGMMVISLTPNQHISSVLSLVFYALWNLFSGFIIPRPRMPVWWRWCSWANPLSWTLYGLVVSQYGDVQKTIETNETLESFIKDYFGFKYDFLGVVAAVVIGFAALFAFLFSFGIRFLNFQRR